MYVYRLNPVTYLPEQLIEGYNSMVWTERYTGSGEFELRTSKVFETMELMPEDSFIGLGDSAEIMVVETRSIAYTENGYAELTVKGRTIETFLENRAMFPTVYGENWKVLQQYTVPEMAALLLWNHLVNNTGEDPSRIIAPQDSYTALPNLVITETYDGSSDLLDWYLEQGVVYDQFKDFINLGVVGVRTIRPLNTSGNVVTFDTSLTESRGVVSKTFTEDISQARIDLHNGKDRTQYQTDRPAVIFHYDSGHVDKPSYLFSMQNYRNVAYVASKAAKEIVFGSDIPTNISGWDRRIVFVDAGQDENSTEHLSQKGLVELQNHSLARMFDGSISPTAPFKYGKDYFLGDYVTVLARLGFESIMLVNEYIRTEDHEGDRGYPGLSSVYAMQGAWFHAK